MGNLLAVRANCLANFAPVAAGNRGSIIDGYNNEIRRGLSCFGKDEADIVGKSAPVRTIVSHGDAQAYVLRPDGIDNLLFTADQIKRGLAPTGCLFGHSRACRKGKYECGRSKEHHSLTSAILTRNHQHKELRHAITIVAVHP